MYAFVISLMRVACLTHYNFLNLIILTIFVGEECKLWNLTLGIFLHSLISTLLGPNRLAYTALYRTSYMSKLTQNLSSSSHQQMVACVDTVPHMSQHKWYTSLRSSQCTSYANSERCKCLFVDGVLYDAFRILVIVRWLMNDKLQVLEGSGGDLIKVFFGHLPGALRPPPPPPAG
jgi:hypothetical protein